MIKASGILRAVLLVLALGLVLATLGCSGNSIKENKRANDLSADDKSGIASISDKRSDTGEILALADAAYVAKDWQTAEKNYVVITRAIPKESHPWFRLGNIYARTDRPDFAVGAYKEALLRTPGLGKAWYNMGLVQLRQSANSFLQMRTYAEENSQSQIRADTMYKATIGLIKDGPNSARSFPLESGGAVKAPAVNRMPAVPIKLNDPVTPSSIDTNPASKIVKSVDQQAEKSTTTGAASSADQTPNLGGDLNLNFPKRPPMAADRLLEDKQDGSPAASPPRGEEGGNAAEAVE